MTITATQLPTPTRKRVLVRLDEPATETAGGIALPAAAKARYPIGEVVAAGDEVFEILGDRVFFAEYGSARLEIGGEIYAVVEIDSIHAFWKAA